MTKLMTVAALVAMMASTAGAYTPHQDMTFREFVEAAGCVLNEVKGKAGNVLYLEFETGCPAANEFMPRGSALVDHDDDASTPDIWEIDNN